MNSEQGWLWLLVGLLWFCWMHCWWSGWRVIKDLRSLVVEEREKCAQIAEAEQVNADETGDESDISYNSACHDIAAAIRAIGQK